MDEFNRCRSHKLHTQDERSNWDVEEARGLLRLRVNYAELDDGYGVRIVVHVCGLGGRPTRIHRGFKVSGQSAEGMHPVFDT